MTTQRKRERQKNGNWLTGPGTNVTKESHKGSTEKRVPSFNRIDLMNSGLSTSKCAFIIFWTRSKPLSVRYCFIIDFVAAWNYKYFLSPAFRSLINLCVHVCLCVQHVSVLVDAFSWWWDWFFSPLWCGTPRSRCASIPINSIERSLIVPLRPARKLKLTMEWERKRMREMQRAAKSKRQAEMDKKEKNNVESGEGRQRAEVIVR